MEDIKSGLTRGELKRLRKYSDLISTSGRSLEVLTIEESRDLEHLLKKAMLAQGVFTKAKMNMVRS